MPASINPVNYYLFVSSQHLASFPTPSRLIRVANRRKGMNLGLNIGGCEGRGGFIGFNGCGDRNGGDRVVGRCGVGGGDWDLEAEILEFMRKSGKPAAFPNRKELMEAGRMDLVVGIEREGGWLALGWDLEDEVVGCGGDVVRDWEAIMARQCDTEAPEMRSDTVQGKSSMVEDGSKDFGSESSRAASSSDGTLGVNGEEATGIEGILSRLEKERSTAFGVTLKEREMLDHALSYNGGSSQGVPPLKSLPNTTVVGHDRSSEKGINYHLGTRSQDSVSSDFGDSLNSIRLHMRQSWSKRAGISDMDVEAAEVSLVIESDTGTVNVSGDAFLATKEGKSQALDRRKDSPIDLNGSDFIITRIRSLELELSNALQTVKSKSHESTKLKASEDTSEEMQNLSDALEFQQTEIMHTKDALRSLRAKLAILEGKMSLELIHAQKMAEVKQKKIDRARQALHLLRTTCIIWSNSASEVLLAGSFDGWTTQRRMMKSATGTHSFHSLTLKLYPGVYEIKFIVDGTWRIDPLRPITCNSGFENNILIVT